MFTAIVLVCMTPGMNTPNTCYTYTNEKLSESRRECEYDIARGIELGIFEYDDPERGEKWRVVDYYCVNWSAERV